MRIFSIFSNHLNLFKMLQLLKLIILMEYFMLRVRVGDCFPLIGGRFKPSLFSLCRLSLSLYIFLHRIGTNKRIKKQSLKIIFIRKLFITNDLNFDPIFFVDNTLPKCIMATTQTKGKTMEMDYNKLMERSFSDLIETLLILADWDDEKINLDYVKITDEKEQKKMVIKQIIKIGSK